MSKKPRATAADSSNPAPTAQAEPHPVISEVADGSQPISGRGVFVVSVVEDNAVSVQTAFLADDGKALRLPAVFPNREYALEQIEELRQLINQYFDRLVQKKLV